MASTRGSAAASTISRSTVAVNESYGWCTSTSRRSSVVNTSPSCGNADSDGTNAGYFSARRSRSAMAFSPVRSSGPGTW